MNADLMRFVMALLLCLFLAILWATTGLALLKVRDVPDASRNRALALIPRELGFAYGSLFALSHHFPPNNALWVTVPGTALVDAVWGYYLVVEVAAELRKVRAAHPAHDAQPLPFDSSNKGGTGADAHHD
jgi:hypothetical protein